MGPSLPAPPADWARMLSCRCSPGRPVGKRRQSWRPTPGPGTASEVRARVSRPHAAKGGDLLTRTGPGAPEGQGTITEAVSKLSATELSATGHAGSSQTSSSGSWPHPSPPRLPCPYSCGRRVIIPGPWPRAPSCIPQPRPAHPSCQAQPWGRSPSPAQPHPRSPKHARPAELRLAPLTRVLLPYSELDSLPHLRRVCAEPGAECKRAPPSPPGWGAAPEEPAARPGLIEIPLSSLEGQRLRTRRWGPLGLRTP